MPEPTRTIVLAKWHDKWDDKCLPPLFAELVQLAYPIVETYLGDLYHDALWLNDVFATDLRDGSQIESFYFSCNRNGTIATRDRTAADYRRENVWHITVRLRTEKAWAYSGIWIADITKVSQ